MKNKSLFLILLFALLMPWAAKAQTTVTIGEGTATSNTNPIGTYYNYSITEQLYTAEEIGMAGTISSVSFYYMGIAAKDLPITVYMANVDAENLSSGISLAEADEVFNGTLSVPATAGWVTIDLDAPFAYDGTSNLLIGFIKDYLYYFSGQSWQGTATTATMARYTQSDSAGPYTTSTVPSSTQTNRPNIQMEITPSGGATCEKPATLEVSNITGYGATFHWESEVGNYAFEIKKASETDWNVYSISDNTLVLSTLEPYTNYNARVKAVCSADLESGYRTANFTTLDVCPEGKICIGEGTATNSYLPTYNFYNYSLTEQIYTAEEIGQAGAIESVDIYSVGSVTRTLEFYMVSTEKETFTSGTDWIAATASDLVYNGSVTFAANSWNTIEFDNPFIYDGRSNVALIVRDMTGSYASSINFYVFDAPSQAIRIYNDDSAYDLDNPGTGTVMNVKNRVRLAIGEPPACPKPTGLTVRNIFGHSAELSWTSDASAWQLAYNNDGGAEFREIDVTTNPYTWSELEPETEYFVKVRANCGDDGYSDWSNLISFTTDVACAAPTDMVISDITAYTANVAWTSDNTNIEMRYSPDVRPITTFDDSQMNGWTNIDADGDGYVWVLGSACGGIYLVETGSLAGSGHNESADLVTSGSYSNMSGVGALTPDNYLVSPQVTLGGTISFWACGQDASYAAEHFGVAVSTTGNTDPADFTTIQEWTMTAKSAGMRGIFRSNAPRGGNNLRAGNWYQYTVDLSAYSGQGYVAIRHFDCTDQFMLNVDDIYIEEPGFELPWVYVTNPASPQALSNLEPETTYLVQVRANCGSEGYSQWLEGSFTTLPACMVPTDLVVSNVDKRSADLAWTSNGEETAWQIMINGDEANLIDVTETTYAFTRLEPSTNYTVKVRAVCDEELQSAWSDPATFTTLVACPAPTNLAISDITNVSAVASWTYDGDIELEYAEDAWRYYDNGTYATSMGAGGTVYWGIMVPASSLPAGTPLTKVALHTSYAGEATMNIYLGGDLPTDRPVATQSITMVGDGDYMEIVLDAPIDIDGTQDLWITFYQSGVTYPADGCSGPTDPNGRWISLDGEDWMDIAEAGYDYTWMIRAGFGDATTEWVAVDNAASPQTIASLTPETPYVVRVRAICGGEDGESVWVTARFTTDVACPAPEALAATPYANSAVLSWEGISESYTVRYGYDEVDQTLYTEDFAERIPSDWTNDATYPWTLVDGYIQSGNAGVGSSTSTISFTMNVSADANFEFDAQCMGEGTSTVWDKCIFSIDGTEMFTIGANGEQWDHYSFPITAGEHTFTWSFTKDSSVNGTGDHFAVDNIAINQVNRVWNTTTADTNECTLTGLTPMTVYYVQVQGDCGDVFGLSEWTELISFTTTADACPVPTNLTVDAETLTATTADLSWEGSPDVESFTVRYRAPEHAAEGSLYEPFNADLPTGWTRYSGLVDNVIAGSATLSTASGYWNSNSYALGAYNMKLNIYGTSCNYWLVTPEVTPTNGNFTFDLALTDYNNADPIEDATAQADDRFVVLVYANETWTILREWNNSGSDYVYNTIATTGEQVSIDLSAYVGQTIKIAFYGESTASGGDNDMHIDNVLIGTLIPATEWEEVSTEEMTVTLTGLTPETTYEAQVKADCSEAENPWSNTVTFTTLEQTSITQTIELSAGTNYFSTYVDITLDDLKTALVAALPGTTIVISSQTQSTTYNGSRWRGQLNTMDVTKMYMIKVSQACEFTLEGMPIDPAEHPITIENGANWIAFPLNASMTPTNAFAGFAVSGDIVSSQTTSSTYNGSRWRGQLNNLVPGQGYIYKSAATETRILTFPTAK